jgi:hypothetical protein
MLRLTSGDVTVSAKSANKLFKRAKAAGVDFTSYTVYSGEDYKQIIATVRVDAGKTGYASRNGYPVWQFGFADTIQSVRLFVETHRLRNHGKIPTDLTPLVVVSNL